MRHFLCLIAFVIAGAARADTVDPDLPALYRVIGVAADDVLNVREAPDAAAAIIGALDPAAEAVEVVALSREGGWGLTNFGERAGWVAMRYLGRHREDGLAADAAARLTCFGTEPFWTITGFDRPALRLLTPDGGTTHPQSRPVDDAMVTQAARYGLRLTWEDTSGPVTAHILRGQCGDGMSDRAYGLHYVDDAGRLGCCSLN